jgi:hypothetical protein
MQVIEAQSAQTWGLTITSITNMTEHRQPAPIIQGAQWL